MFLYYRGVNPNVAVNGNVKFVDTSERRSKRVKHTQLLSPRTVTRFIAPYTAGLNMHRAYYVRYEYIKVLHMDNIITTKKCCVVMGGSKSKERHPERYDICLDFRRHKTNMPTNKKKHDRLFGSHAIRTSFLEQDMPLILIAGTEALG